MTSGIKKLSDKEILQNVRNSLDSKKIKELGVGKERLNAFFSHIERLLVIDEDKKSDGCFTIHVDGASRGNPGPAGIGVVLADARGKTIKELREFIGTTTNNVAEYRSLIRGLDLALDFGASAVKIYTDSELMANQVQGNFRVKSRDLIPLYEIASEKIARFEKAEIEHVPRGQSRRADILANMAIDFADSN